MIVTTYIGDPYESEAINPTTATKFSRAKIHPDRLGTSLAAGMQAKAAYLSVEEAAIMFTQDGTTATATVMHELAAGDSLLIVGAVALNQFQMIDKSSASTVKVTYFF